LSCHRRTLSAECPADFNEDGVVNGDDLADCIACYFGMPPCPNADFNADGVLNPDDLADYVTSYFAGCEGQPPVNPSANRATTLTPPAAALPRPAP
jgi:hypothetical protein